MGFGTTTETVKRPIRPHRIGMAIRALLADSIIIPYSITISTSGTVIRMGAEAITIIAMSADAHRTRAATIYSILIAIFNVISATS
jgi:hypothetical protein